MGRRAAAKGQKGQQESTCWSEGAGRGNPEWTAEIWQPRVCLPSLLCGKVGPVLPFQSQVVPDTGLELERGEETEALRKRTAEPMGECGFLRETKPPSQARAESSHTGQKGSQRLLLSLHMFISSGHRPAYLNACVEAWE